MLVKSNNNDYKVKFTHGNSEKSCKEYSMLELSGIALTDEINLYDQKFTLGAMLSAYEDCWDEGIPSYVNHDHRKHLGWVNLNGIYMEPGTAYITNRLQVGTTDEEIKRLQEKSYQYLFKKRVEERKEQYETLISKVGDKLSSHYKHCWVNAISIYDEGIVQRVLPDLFERIEDGLIDVNELKSVLPGVYKYNDYLLFAHNFFRRGFSRLNTLNSEFLSLLQEIRKPGVSVKIALDLNCIGLLGTEELEFEYQYWWGPKFNDDLGQIPLGVTTYKNEHYDGYMSDVLRTEFGWYILSDIQTFECEEITDIPNISYNAIDYYGCRFVHSKLDPISGKPFHLDGAIRAYTDEKMLQRLDIDIKKTKRDTLYTKIWRVDGEIEVNLWKTLITHYYRDNMLIGEYFGGSDKKINTQLVNRPSYIEKKFEDFIPTDIQSDSGLRVNVSFKKIEHISADYDVIVKPQFFYNDNTGLCKYYESETVTLIKMLKKKMIRIREPFCKKIAFEDLVFNFPLFICNSKANSDAINECINELCNKWYEDKDDRLLTFSIQINYETKSVLFSFAGHINDFVSFFKINRCSFPEDEAGLSTWLNRIYDFQNTYPPVNQCPKVNNILAKGGILWIKRVFVDPSTIIKTEKENGNTIITLKLLKEEFQIMNEKGIWVAPVFKINSTKCSSCKKEYCDCECIKFVDPNLAEVMSGVDLLGYTWTNRSAMYERPIMKINS